MASDGGGVLFDVRVAGTRPHQCLTVYAMHSRPLYHVSYLGVRIRAV